MTNGTLLRSAILAGLSPNGCGIASHAICAHVTLYMRVRTACPRAHALPTAACACVTYSKRSSFDASRIERSRLRLYMVSTRINRIVPISIGTRRQPKTEKVARTRPLTSRRIAHALAHSRLRCLRCHPLTTRLTFDGRPSSRHPRSRTRRRAPQHCISCLLASGACRRAVGRRYPPCPVRSD